jgi:DHA2 family multidrug resistance protein
VASAYDPASPANASALDAMINQQAAMIAYINDFRLMLYLTIAVLPLLLFIRPPRGNAAPADAHAVMD